MGEIVALSNAEKQFMQPFLPASASINRKQDPAQGASNTNQDDHREDQKPFVTLTYASSLDGMISLASGVRTTLSGLETKNMTHYLRLHHDAILVGVGTAIADDPSLNCRYPDASIDLQPRPVVLDPDARWDVKDAKVVKLAAEKKGKTPWLIHRSRDSAEASRPSAECERLVVGKDSHPPKALDLQGRRHMIQWHSILQTLHEKGIRSVMIEGGATIIAELLTRPDIVDAVIVTVAPTWLGKGGVAISPAPKNEEGQRVNSAHLEGTAWRQFGQDVVLCGKLSP